MSLKMKARSTSVKRASRSRAKHTVRKILVTTFVMTALLVSAGVGYAWYTGSHSKVAVPTQADVVTSAPVIKTYTPPPTATVGVSTQSFTSTVKRGTNAELSIKTNPKAACSIRVEYKDHVLSTDSGLVPKVADEYGLVSWTWTVETSRPVGTWPVKVLCANSKNSGALQLDMVVQ